MSLDARYGRTAPRRARTRLIAILAGAGVLVVVVAWVIWAGLLGPSASLETRDLGYTLQDASTIEVRYEVTVDAGRSVACAVQALDAGFEIVGWKVVELPASEQVTRRFSETLRTSQEAVTGLIYRCWLT